MASVALVLAGTTATAEPATGWRVVDLGVLNNSCLSYAQSINDRGDVAGTSAISPPAPCGYKPPVTAHATLWRDGQIVDLGTLGGQFSEAFGINNRGEIAGRSDTLAGLRAFYWRDGHMIDLGTLGGSQSEGLAINDRGEVVGASNLHGDNVYHAFVWRHGTMTDLGSLWGSHSIAFGINNRGEIVGSDLNPEEGLFHAVRWVDGVEIPVSQRSSDASAINNRGQVVGTLNPGGPGPSAFLLGRGRLRELPVPPESPNASANASNINDRGQVVGEAGGNPVLWEHGNVVVLPKLVGLDGMRPTAINNHGTIAGYGSTQPFGFPRAVLWTR